MSKQKSEKVINMLKRMTSGDALNLIEDFNKAFKSPKYHLKVPSDGLPYPCQFVGDIQKPGKVVVVSLNPGYAKGVSEAEQKKFKNIEKWYEYCRNRFQHYERPQDLHAIFMNLFKVIAPQECWEELDDCRHEYLQKHLINLDWCCYYSEKFPTVKAGRLMNGVCQLMKRWDENIDKLIKIAKPRLIFAHGKSLEVWFNKNVNHSECLELVKGGRGKMCKLLTGKYRETKMPVYYLEHSVSTANSNDALSTVGKYLQARIAYSG